MKNIYLTLFALSFFVSGTAQYTTDSIQFGGVSRKFLLYVPPTYDGSTNVPFVMALHGLGDDMNNFKNIRFDRVADTANFIFAIPQALVDGLSGSTAWNSGAGSFGITLNPNVDDVGFLNALIDTISERYMIDQTQVYATGFSMGGFMSNRLACELNNRIAAIASVSGTIGNGLTCSPSRAIPVAHFHGTADQTVNYTGNLFGNDAEALVAYWARHDRCDTANYTIDSIPHTSANNLRIVHFKYPNGAYGTDVEFFKVLGGQHLWLGPSGYDINYAVEIWKFFRRYRWQPQASTGIQESGAAFQLSLSPNPASSILNCYVGDIQAEPLLRIYDLLGHQCYEQAISAHDTELPFGQLSKGVYLVKVSDRAGRSSTQKIVVE